MQHSVCVYCGSRPGDDDAFTQDAETLGRGLAQAGLRLVYGAGDVGLMGSVARAAQTAGGDTFGVIPAHLDRDDARAQKSDVYELRCRSRFARRRGIAG